MNNEDTPDQDWDQEDEKPRRNGSRRRDRKLMLEEEIRKVAEDDLQKAREIVMIRKELNRLHYKVKSYHNQARIVNGIVQIVIVILLLVITYRLYTTDIPVH
jgi:hypothetical protein